MRVVRLRKSQQSLQPDLARRGVEEIDTSNHVRHALIGIVDDDGELVGNQTVAATDDEVTGIRVEVEPRFGLPAVLDNDGFDGRTHPHGTVSQAAVAADSRVAVGVTGGTQLPSTALAIVGVALLNERVNGRLVQRQARALVATFAVVIQAVRGERGNDIGCRAWDFTWWVDVLNTQQPAAAVVVRIEVADKRTDE